MKWEFKPYNNLNDAAKACEALLDFDVAVQNYWKERESSKHEFLDSLDSLIDASIKLQSHMVEK